MILFEKIGTPEVILMLLIAAGSALLVWRISKLTAEKPVVNPEKKKEGKEQVTPA